jgi:hypothetical protein
MAQQYFDAANVLIENIERDQIEISAPEASSCSPRYGTTERRALPGPQSADGEPLFSRFGNFSTYISKVRLFFASVNMYNPARFVFAILS